MYSCETLARFVLADAKPIPLDAEGTIYWSLLNWSPDMEKLEQIEVFREVFEHYNYELWPIRFRSTSERDKAYFKIAFVGDDGNVTLHDSVTESPYSFKANPDTIAVCFFNTESIWSGWLLVNDAYFFAKVHSDERKSLSTILTHELGHGVGLSHTNARGDIMLGAYDPENKFTQDSRNGLHALFGARRNELMRSVPAAQILTMTITKRKGCVKRTMEKLGLTR